MYPAIIRALTDRQADIERLVENIHREDLTNAEKGDAIWSLVENYPDEYPTIKSVCEALTLSYSTVKDDWCRKSRKLSDFVKGGLGTQALNEDTALRLSKYDYVTQDRLAKCVIENELSGETMRAFFRLYDANPKADLNELANEAKGLKTVRVSLAELSPKTKKEVLEKIKVEHKPPPKPTEEIKKKMSETRKDTEERKKAGKEKKPKSQPPLLPEERERLEKMKDKEIGKIVREREKRGEFMQAKAELAEEKIEVPLLSVINASTMLSRRNVTDEKRLNLLEAKDWMVFSKSWFTHNPPEIHLVMSYGRSTAYAHELLCHEQDGYDYY